MIRPRPVQTEHIGEKTRRSRAFPSHPLPRRTRMVLTALLSYDAVAFHLGQGEKLMRCGKLATSSARTF
jgi:hypothetical protein